MGEALIISTFVRFDVTWCLPVFLGVGSPFLMPPSLLRLLELWNKVSDLSWFKFLLMRTNCCLKFDFYG